jgi:hypothetical protein
VYFTDNLTPHGERVIQYASKGHVPEGWVRRPSKICSFGNKTRKGQEGHADEADELRARKP